MQTAVGFKTSLARAHRPVAAKATRNSGAAVRPGALRVVAYREDDDRSGPGPLLQKPSWPGRGPRADVQEGRRKAETYGELWSAKAEGLLQRAKAKLDSSAPALQAKWESIEDKGTVVGLGLTALLALYVGTGVLDRLDRIPLVSTLLELVGLVVVGSTAFKWEQIRTSIKDFVNRLGF
ncbi:hypothetical protein N2152v2_006120 [Parachlorella kessleri]